MAVQRMARPLANRQCEASEARGVASATDIPPK
jgi:hypothetical protein